MWFSIKGKENIHKVVASNVGIHVYCNLHGIWNLLHKNLYMYIYVDETRQSVHVNYMYAPTGNTCMHNAISKLHIAGKF